ncbi:MAG: polymerase subunit sigma-70 [Mucilaginibacter sp.]|nr:polymerase subunit sigma-70 [Mucilaginibacter sp.]
MTAITSYTDVELAELLKSGNQLAFTELYNRYNGLIYIYACKITGDNDIAEDLVQELFVNLWDKRQIINFTSSVSSYLYAAVRYKFFDLVDKQKVRSDYAQNFQLFLDNGEHLTDNYILEKELANIIEKEIDKLPAKMRRVFLLSRKENLTNKQIAVHLDISEKTVKNQLSTALKTLKLKLGLVTFLLMLIHY